MTKGLRNSDTKIPNNIRLFRKALLNNHAQIEITDFGAGSKVFKDNKRIVSQLAATAGISRKRGELLFKTLNYFKPKTILEIGTSLGIATSYMAGFSDKTEVYTLEGCPTIAGLAKKHLDDFNFNNVTDWVLQFGDFPELNKLREVINPDSFDESKGDYLIKKFKKELISFNQDSLFQAYLIEVKELNEIMGSGSAPADLKSDEAEPDMEESKAGAAPKNLEEAAPKKPEEAAPKKKPEEAAPKKKQKKVQPESEPSAAPTGRRGNKRGQPSAGSAESAAADVEASAKGSGNGKRPRRGGGVVAD